MGRDEAADAGEEYLNALETEMLDAAEKLEFERAAALRDKILELRSAEGDNPRRPAASPQAAVLVPARGPKHAGVADSRAAQSRRRRSAGIVKQESRSGVSVVFLATESRSSDNNNQSRAINSPSYNR